VLSAPAVGKLLRYGLHQAALTIVLGKQSRSRGRRTRLPNRLGKTVNSRRVSQPDEFWYGPQNWSQAN
jgi:hypothetical protein